MPPSSLNLVPPAPFPQPLASDVDDIPPVIVDEADLPAEESSKGEEGQVEPLASHPQGVDAGEANRDHKVFNGSEDGMIRDSLTLGELRRYVEGAAFKAKVIALGIPLTTRNHDNTRFSIAIQSPCKRKLRSVLHIRIFGDCKRG